MAAELIPVDTATAPPTLFGSDDPNYIMASATAKANALAKVIKDKSLYSSIQGRSYVRVEGWTLLGSLLGVFPVCTWTRKLDDGWEARVEARTLSGQIVGAAEAQCSRDESTWKNRSEYALRSMAQTRATSKALRLPLGFVMSMAGYESTPAEEIPEEDRRPAPKPAPQRARQQPVEGEVVPATGGPEGTEIGQWWAATRQAGMDRNEVMKMADALFGDEPMNLTAEQRTEVFKAFSS